MSNTSAEAGDRNPTAGTRGQTSQPHHAGTAEGCKVPSSIRGSGWSQDSEQAGSIRPYSPSRAFRRLLSAAKLTPSGESDDEVAARVAMSPLHKKISLRLLTHDHSAVSALPACLARRKEESKGLVLLQTGSRLTSSSLPSTQYLAECNETCSRQRAATLRAESPAR